MSPVATDMRSTERLKRGTMSAFLVLRGIRCNGHALPGAIETGRHGFPLPVLWRCNGHALPGAIETRCQTLEHCQTPRCNGHALPGAIETHLQRGRMKDAALRQVATDMRSTERLKLSRQWAITLWACCCNGHALSGAIETSSTSETSVWLFKLQRTCAPRSD